jgi:hypothetical protein
MISVGAILRFSAFASAGTASDAAPYEHSLRRRFADDARIIFGERKGAYLPVSACTENPDEDRALWEEVAAQPGVEHIDFVCAQVDEEQQSTSSRANLTADPSDPSFSLTSETSSLIANEAKHVDSCPTA